MNVVLILPVVVAIIGLLVFLLTPETSHKVGEAGRLAYFAGLLVAVLVFAQAAVRIG